MQKLKKKTKKKNKFTRINFYRKFLHLYFFYRLIKFFFGSEGFVNLVDYSLNILSWAAPKIYRLCFSSIPFLLPTSHAFITQPSLVLISISSSIIVNCY